LEVPNLLLGLQELQVDSLLFSLHAPFLVLEVADIKLDGFLLVIQVKPGVTKSLDFINLGIFAELGVEVVIIIVVILFFELFFIGFVDVILSVWVFLLNLLRSSPLLCDFFVEGQDLVIVLVVRVNQVVELGKQLGFFFFDVLYFGPFCD